MDIVRSLTKEEMVGEFLRAELHSSRFRAGSLKALQMRGFDEDLLENPSYNDYKDNNRRALVLGVCRGWPDKELFVGFPGDTKWYYAHISSSELQGVYRLKSDDRMSENQRLLQNTARRVMNDEKVANVDNDLIGEIRTKIESGQELPPIIAVCVSLDTKKVLIEGHSRSIAYCSSSDQSHNIPVIIGVSHNMTKWAYF